MPPGKIAARHRICILELWSEREDGRYKGILLSVTSKVLNTGHDPARLLAEQLWRATCYNGRAMHIRNLGPRQIAEISLDWEFTCDQETRREVHSLWAYLDGEQWDTGLRMAWRSEEVEEEA